MKEIKNLRKRREKHFDNGDGTITLKMYNDDIHYLKNGKYETIDNKVIKKDSHYENKANDFKVSFEENSDDLLNVKIDNHFIKMYLKNTNNLTPEKDGEKLIYKEILKDVDVFYNIIGSKVKESIVLKNKNNIPKLLEFIIETDTILNLKDNGKIEASFNNETIFIIDTPFMKDSLNEINTDISYELIKEDKNYTLKLSLDNPWLYDTKREYPVIVDPTIINGQGENVFNVGLCLQEPQDSSEYLYIGASDFGIDRVALKFILPNINPAYNIVESCMFLNSYSLATFDNRGICVHSILNEWDERTANWNNMINNYDSKIETVFFPSVISNEEGITSTKIDLTNVVREWYNGKPNNGILLKWENENKIDTVAAPVYHILGKADDYYNGTALRPYLTITYKNQNGLLNYMTYSEIDISSGKTYINNYNGNLHTSFYLNRTISNKLPITLNINYNTYDILNNKTNSFIRGWKFNYEEKLEFLNGVEENYLKYVDGSNAEYYFYKNSSGVYEDEDGLNIKVYVENNSCKLVDKTGNTKLFENINGMYLLTKIIDTNSNEIKINYSNGKINNLVDANDKTINITYSEKEITVISDYDTVILSLNNNTLSSIKNKYGVINLSYNDKNLLEKIVDTNLFNLKYEYTDDNLYKLKTVFTEFKDHIIESSNFIYEFNQTTVIDKANKKIVYDFNNIGLTIGKTLFTSEDEKLENIPSSKFEYYDGEDKNKKNKIISSAPYVKYINNLLPNGGFENDYDFPFELSEDASGTDKSSTGNMACQIYGEVNRDFKIQDEGYYTFSFDMNINPGDLNPYVYINMYSIENDVSVLLDSITLSYIYENMRDKYQRYTLTGYFNKNSICRLNFHSKHYTNIFIDNIQLEKGKAANLFNLVDNSNFKYNLGAWNSSIFTFYEDMKDTKFYEFTTIPTNETALKINSDSINEYTLSQKINISAKKGNVYYLSFWYKNEGHANAYSKKEGNKVRLTFGASNDNDKDKEIYEYNLYKNNSKWSYFSKQISIDKDYKDIEIAFLSLHEVNCLYVTNIMLLENVGYHTFDYDNEGNLISTTGNDKEKSEFKYDTNNQLISSFNPKGNNFKYEYDNKVTNRLLKGISPTGISNEIKYDNNGNPVKTIINNVNPDGVLVNGDKYLIRSKGTDKYVTYNLSSAKVNIQENLCNYDEFKLIKEGGYYRLAVGNRYITLLNDEILFTSMKNDNSLFAIEINDNGSYSIFPKTDLFKCIGIVEDYLKLKDKDVNDSSNQFYFEDINTPLYIENKSYYTEDGRFVTRVEDALGKVTQYDVDESTGLVKKVINPKGYITTTEYNDKDQIISVINSKKTVKYDYNNQNLLSTITSGTKNYNFTYDDFLNTKTISINNNTLADYTYDNLNNNLIKLKYGTDSEINYVYDTENKLSEVIKENEIYTYSYDKMGNLSYIESPNHLTKFHYDLAARLKQYEFDNLIVVYKYDENSNIKSKIYFDKLYQNIFEEINYEFNKDDSVIKEIIDNNVINYNYDYLGRMTSSNINDNINIEYTYFTKGDKTSLLLNTMKIDNEVYRYLYDDLYNITHIYLNEKLINEYEYDNINELITERNYLSNRKYKYSYDEEGNIEHKYEFNLTTDVLIKEDNYEYSNPNWEDQLTKFNDTEITYDNIGNPITIGSANLSWINGRELKEYKDTDLDIKYEYNINGIRTSKIVNGERTNYYLEGTSIVIEKKNNNVIYYIRDNKENLIGLKCNGETYYYKKNYQGDIIGIYDNNYNQIVSYKYDSWGNIISIEDSSSNNIGRINPYRYRSYYYDEETKLYYLNSRYYNPLWGRFINADGIIGANGNNDYNLYAYCNNNPIIMIDTEGKTPKIIDRGIYISLIDPTSVGATAILGGLGLLGGVAAATASSIALLGVAGITVLGLIGLGYNEITQSKTEETKPNKKEPHQEYFPVNPNDFKPKGLEKVYHPGTKNGAIIEWIIPSTDFRIFEWNEGLLEDNGPHYHALKIEWDKKHYGLHYYPGMPVPEPWNSTYFGG